MKLTCRFIIAFFLFFIGIQGVKAQSLCLSAQFNFNGDVKDSTGQGNDGENFGATFAEDRFGNPNGSLHFDGVDDYVSLPFKNLLHNNYTYSAWVKAESKPANSKFYAVLHIGSRVGQDQSMHYAYHTSQNLMGWVAGSYDENGASNSLSEDNSNFVSEWFHVASVRTDTTFALFVNGVKVDSSNFLAVAPTYGTQSEANIGSRFNEMSYFFGWLDDIYIYDCALSDVEIVEIFDDGQNPGGNPCLPIFSNDSIMVDACDSIMVHGDYQSQEGLYSDTLIAINGCDSISNVYLDVLCQSLDTVYTTIFDTNYVFIEDTVFNTFYDTVAVTIIDTIFTQISDTIPVYTSISVTDTLVIYYSASSVNTMYGIDILVYPNPTSDMVTVDCVNAGLISDFTFNITLGSGPIVFQSYFSSSKIEIPLSGLSGPGFYFLNVFNGSGVKITTKIIVLE